MEIKKRFREIKDVRFMESQYMPYKEDRAEVLEWLKNNESFLSYVKKMAFKMMEYDPGTRKWQGVNYGKDERELYSEGCTTGWSVNLYTNIEASGIDLLPPQKTHKFHIYADDELIAYLKQEEKLIRFFEKCAIWNRYIVKDEVGWVGCNNKF
ncbi:hypothetical protein BW721_04860 [Jeotgalibaca sp. PTS2502]|uniref:hypothetical protein n=1 Tax=Jeotgalibaca sp. PTS2502 TaxID=1903686 RepID=UPI000973B1B6|nr:hypothetical protein [Jeotgalibaca sp. PTS2502]APZ49067.1 hypothetical protein BW721_04860 [Jeotgalibaca sp. PTS2502]